MIDRLIGCVRTVIAEWHGKGLDFFELDHQPSPGADTLEKFAAKLAYHNYQGWHYEAWMREAGTAEVASATRKTFIHNRGRNSSVERIDAAFFELQKGEGEYYSETPGMLLDRLSILYLKLIYSEPDEGERQESLRHQIEFLSECARRLGDGLLDGSKQIVSFERTKHFLREEQASC